MSLNELKPTICPPTIGVLVTTVNVVALTTVTVRSAPDAGSEERGYGCNVEWLSLSQVKTNELSTRRTLAPVERPWLVVVTIVKIPEYAWYEVPVVAVKVPDPPEIIVIPFPVADLKMWTPLNVSVFALNWPLISSINSTFAVVILNRSLIFLFWKVINLDNPLRMVVSVAKSKSFWT